MAIEIKTFWKMKSVKITSGNWSNRNSVHYHGNYSEVCTSRNNRVLYI